MKLCLGSQSSIGVKRGNSRYAALLAALTAGASLVGPACASVTYFTDISGHGGGGTPTPQSRGPLVMPTEFGISGAAVGTVIAGPLDRLGARATYSGSSSFPGSGFSASCMAGLAATDFVLRSVGSNPPAMVSGTLRLALSGRMLDSYGGPGRSSGAVTVQVNINGAFSFGEIQATSSTGILSTIRPDAAGNINAIVTIPFIDLPVNTPFSVSVFLSATVGFFGGGGAEQDYNFLNTLQFTRQGDIMTGLPPDVTLDSASLGIVGNGVPPACRGDWNDDGVIDFNDLLGYLNDYNTPAARADLNRDGAVDFNDLLEFLNLYNTPC